MTIRTLIVDDEMPARDRIRDLLEKEDGVEIVGECENGSAALAAIRRQKPDLIFLDVQMPELSGFDVLNSLNEAETPVVVFVTAFDQFALKAFEFHALDYLLKPFDRARFTGCLQRARRDVRRRRAGELSEKLLALLSSVRDGPKETGSSGSVFLERMVIKSAGRVFFVRVDEIDWIEAAGNYLRLHIGSESHLHRETLTRLESRLDPANFIRIHRSFLVNIDRIREMQPWAHGEFVVILNSGKRLTSSRGYRERLQKLLEKSI